MLTVGLLLVHDVQVHVSRVVGPYPYLTCYCSYLAFGYTFYTFDTTMSDDDDLRFSDLEENSDDHEDEVKPNLKLNQTCAESDEDDGKKVQGMRHLRQMSSALGLDKFKAKAASRRERKRRAKLRKKGAQVRPKDDDDETEARMVQTEASKKLGMETKTVEVVTHRDNRRKKRKRQDAKEEDDNASQEVTMKDARFDVFQLGVSGMGKDKRADAEVDMLVRLGAKPPKVKRTVSYPELKAQMREEKEKERQRKELERISGVAHGVFGTRGKSKQGASKDAKKGRNKNKNKAGGRSESLQSKVGKFDGGMLKLSAKDLMKIKGKK